MYDQIVAPICFHCGDECSKNEVIQLGDKSFCCHGCVSVYQLLHQNGMEEYYCLNATPGSKAEPARKEKFAFLDEPSVIKHLLLFSSKEQAQVSFFLPQMHCSSCLWLLENLPQLNKNITHAQVNFTDKTVKILYQSQEITLRQVAELLAYLGYEPSIDMHESKDVDVKKQSKRSYLKLGITGFCFANIMLIAFPEYLGLDAATQPKLAMFFKMVNVALSIPVVFYGAREFFVNAWYSFRQRYLNVDVPIAFAITVTYLRSLYEVFTNTGGGYFDSMAGIVFFMLLGRTLQNRSYSSLKFNRDFKSYFPIAITRIDNGQEQLIQLEKINEQDVLLIHHQEIIPTDCMLMKGSTLIDYSFITGEQKPETTKVGELIYAGGRNMGNAIEVVAVKAFQQNSFTSLWNNTIFQKQQDDKQSRVTIISKYFSFVVFAIAISAFLFWMYHDASVAWNAATAVLIIACPCALLLTASFTNGYLMDRFAQHGFFVKNAMVLERLTKIQHIAFDKTGTLTDVNSQTVEVVQDNLSAAERAKVLQAMAQSMHPMSKAIVAFYQYKKDETLQLNQKEIPGSGIEVWDNNQHYKIGSRSFVFGHVQDHKESSRVYVGIDDEVKAVFAIHTILKPGVSKMLQTLSNQYQMSLVSGDNRTTQTFFERWFTAHNALQYKMKPQQKLEYIEQLQQSGTKVMMVGDGLNDAGALQQSDVGIAVVQNTFSFSPKSDVIMSSDHLNKLHQYLRWAKGGQRMITIGFIYSLLFNIIGLVFAVSGNLSPMIAAILMPTSSLGIILIAYIGVYQVIKGNNK